MSDETREYQLLCSKPLTDFDTSVLRFLQDWPGEKPPRSYAVVAIPEPGDVHGAGAVVKIWKATIPDLLVMKGHLELHINHLPTMENMETYLWEAEENGVLPCQRYQGDKNDIIDDDNDTDEDGDEEVDTDGDKA